MAATFEVETGSGSATANAYVSVAAADQYHENFGNPAAWSTLTTAQKEAAIRAATQYMDAKYSGRWKGWATYRAQKLDWPRSNVEKRDGFMYDPDDIPHELEDACCSLALEHVNSAVGLLPGLSASSGQVKKVRSKVGELESETEYLSASREAPEFPIVDGLLAPILVSGGGVGVLRRG